MTLASYTLSTTKITLLRHTCTFDLRPPPRLSSLATITSSGKKRQPIQILAQETQRFGIAIYHSWCLIKLRVDLDAHLTSAPAAHVKTMTDPALKLTMAPWWLAQEHRLWLCVICQAPVHSTPFRLFHPPSPKSGQTMHASATHACSHVPTASDLVDFTIAFPKIITTREKPGINIHRLPNTIQFKHQSTAGTQVSPVLRLPRQKDGLSTTLVRRASLSPYQSHLTHLTPPSILLACYDHQTPILAGAQVPRCRFRTRPASRCRCPAKRNEKAHRVSGRVDIEGSKSNVAMNAWLPQASSSIPMP